MSRAEVDLQISVRKACSPYEVPPKRKHVRACIVYTWDHKNSRAFWDAVKIQPLQVSEVQLFKALIMIHKVLQEGHPNTLKDGFRNRDFLASLEFVFPQSSSYGLMINRYDKYLLQKLDFHREHLGFNGMFEYEEYISLRHVNDPNEGYEAILLLIDLQDSITDMQKLIFSKIDHSPSNMCKVSALVPFVSESYGIYKFLISMLRAMYKQLGDDEALSDLFERFRSQHYVLRDFYTDCQAIKFLTSLITIPRIPPSAPDLRISDDSEQLSAPPITSPRPVEASSELSLEHTLNLEVPPTPPPTDLIYLQQSGMFNQQLQMQQQQQAQLEFQRQQQLEEQQRRQRIFEQQKLQQEEHMLREQEALRQQQTQAHTLRVSELEQDLLLFKNQFDNDQALLAQYDNRVKTLEAEMAALNETATQQIASKDEQLRILEEQVNNWAKKYESLAKLYSQLRAEHLNLLSKFKKIQQKILSAQESVLKKEKLEKEVKAKNLELADLIRERDRARLDLDRVRVTKDQEVEKLETQIRDLNAKATELSQYSSLQLTQTQYRLELDRLNTELAEKSMQLTSLGDVTALKDSLKSKDVDMEIMQESLDMALNELAQYKADGTSTQLANLLDVILANNVRRIQDARFEFSSTMQAGNINALPEYVLSVSDVCSDIATDFALAFSEYLAEESSSRNDSTYSSIVLSGSDLSSTVCDLMLNGKGLRQNLSSDDKERLSTLVDEMLTAAETFFLSLTSDILDELDKEDDKMEFVIDCNIAFQEVLQQMSLFLETLRVAKHVDVFKKGNIEDVVDNEMNDAAQAVSQASDFLTLLMASVKLDPNVEVSELLLSCALAITQAVAQLIINATDCQTDIVSRNKGKLSRREFYKKNSRWTEGLISASKAVRSATNVLIQSADGVLKHENSLEQVIVACNEVAASTAQLVAASRVKSHSMSKTLEKLEQSSGSVNGACKALVSKVQQYIDKDSHEASGPDLSTLTSYEGKTLEMEQQVQILKLENSLNLARKRLTEIRKHGYKDDILDEEG